MARKGVVIISDEMYSNQYSLVAGLFQKIRPVRIEHEYWKRGDWLIYADGELFYEVKEGEMPPTYEVTIKNVGGNLEYSLGKIFS